ncbi:cyclic nucleotide-binding domain-containing protein [Hymenobacter nivis]|uniref:Response regulator n=1 Tax=Hymenobacter nivis TaxID=1850093 RepID=A0A502HBZ1_9BACT|nr:cyclic nucleotide-binding domain-containing protein [Hymenobacter nivis]TPG72289.1 response regulator [Hymenobacter nivis]
MKTILLIDGDDAARQSTAELLVLAGYAVSTAGNGKTGVEQARTARPDLVLCAIDLDLLDGYGVLYSFRQNARLAGTPFIFLTARAARADVRRGMELGADDYLTKPFVNSELLGAIAGRLARFQHLHPDEEAPAASSAPAEFVASQRSNLLTLVADRKPHPVPRRQIVYAEGDEPARLYFVQAGRVKIVKTTASGKELITGFYQAGEFFGYKALLEGTVYHDAAVAVEDSTLFYIPADDFAQLLRNPEVSQQLVRLLAGRKREREDQLLDMAYNSLRRRVANALLGFYDHARPDEAAGALIQLSRDDLAAVVGIAPESLSRTLSEFRHDGLLEVTPKGIKLLQPDKLRRTDW